MDEHSMDTDTVWNNPCFQVQIKPCEVHKSVRTVAPHHWHFISTTTVLGSSAQLWVASSSCSVLCDSQYVYVLSD